MANTHNTRVSLLYQLGEGNSAAWSELDSLYRPLISGWLARYDLQRSDVDDLTQEVMVVVARQVESFQHNGNPGAFRNWLKTTAINLARNYLRKKGVAKGKGTSSLQNMLEQLEDPESHVSSEFNRAHDQVVVQRLMEHISSQFAPETLAVFKMHVFEGVSARETAERNGVPVSKVHVAKSRVMRKLREHAAVWADGLIGDEFFGVQDNR